MGKKKYGMKIQVIGALIPTACCCGLGEINGSSDASAADLPLAYGRS